MIRHTVQLRLRPDASESDAVAIIDALRTLPSKIDVIRSYTVCRDLGLEPSNAHIMLTAEFDDIAGYLEYASHPDHISVIVDFIRPVVESRAACQIES
ncbi:MAG: Dabb family protein [Actinobacteria bacterium]|nr:Dabb family protein [Actinomycetota bacterium]MCB9388633.1 Dabb family protein [Acidimicrobiia bacterium]